MSVPAQNESAKKQKISKKRSANENVGIVSAVKEKRGIIQKTNKMELDSGTNQDNHDKVTKKTKSEKRNGNSTYLNGKKSAKHNENELKRESEKMAPKKQSENQAPKKKSEKKALEKQSENQEPKKESQKKAPKKQSEKKALEKQSENQAPKKKSEKNAPEKESEKKAPEKDSELKMTKKTAKKELTKKSGGATPTAPIIKVRSSMSQAERDQYRSEHGIVLIDEYLDADFTPVASFADTGLASNILSCTAGFRRPTPIQAQCWPILLSGRDCVGIAETGSGKTLAFALPALAHVQSRPSLGRTVTDRGPVVLVLSPTRELAMQSALVCTNAGSGCTQRTVCVFGGGDRQEQVRELSRGVHTIVATPGRLLGYMREGVISLERVSYLVLDEADRMLDLGFEPDIRAIVAAVTSQRQTVMFSATWPSQIQALAGEFLRQPVRVTIGTDQLAASANVTQVVEVIDIFDRDGRLDALLRKYHDRLNRVIVFVLYKKEAIRVETQLCRRGWTCTSLHGDKSQSDRTAALDEFRSGRVPILIATDVAARGLDIPEVQYVINYSFPLTIEDYIHRIGRTGRAGSKGLAHTLFTTADKSHSGELINVLNEAGATVPNDLLKFGAGVKRKQHALYGNHFRADDRPLPAKTHVKFN